MILNERESRHEHVLHVARQMMTAARTAPKGKGVDIIEIAMVTDGDINILSEMMVKMVAEHGMKFFLRDAENILNAECVLLIGTHEQAQGLCGYALPALLIGAEALLSVLPPLMVSGSNNLLSLVPVHRFSPDTKMRQLVIPILRIMEAGNV